MSEELAKHLSFFVPPGFLLMKQTEIDRIHNESEARYIELQDECARLAELVRLDGETIERWHAEAIRLAAENEALRNALAAACEPDPMSPLAWRVPR